MGRDNRNVPMVAGASRLPEPRPPVSRCVDWWGTTQQPHEVTIVSEETPMPEGMPKFSIDSVEELRSKIFGADDIVARLVKISEWGDLELEIRSMTGNERAVYLANMQAMAPGGDMNKVDWKNLYPSLLSQVVFAPGRNESGEWVPKISDMKVFTAKDVDALNSKSARAIERLARVAQQLSGLNSNDDDEEADT